MLLIGCWTLLPFTALVIAYQDFKARLISTWLIALFALVNTVFYLSYNPLFQLLQNTLVAGAYLLLCYLVLVLYYFIKNKRFNNIMNTKLGWGDVWLALITGITIEPDYLVFFFTATFSLSLVFQLIFFRAEKNIPLAGYLVLFYLAFIILKLWL